jgi:hypothetical protein
MKEVQLHVKLFVRQQTLISAPSKNKEKGKILIHYNKLENFHF